MTDLFLVFIAACLTNNLVLEYLLGVSPLFAVSRTIETAIGMSVAMLLIVPLTTVSCHVLNALVLLPLHLEYLQVLVFVFLICLLVLLADKLLSVLNPALHNRLAVFIPLLLVNSALLGIVLLDLETDKGLLAAIFFGIGSALGFALMVIAFATIRQRLAAADVPLPFRGASILFITLSIISMAFTGFSGFN